MSRKITFMIASIATAATIALSGCSSEEPTTTPTAAQPSQATSQSASTEASPTEEASAPEDTSSKDDSSKPSKEDVAAGIETFYGKAGMPKDSAEKFAACLVDEMYEKAKTKTLKALADADPTKLDVSDAQLFADASGKCTSAI